MTAEPIRRFYKVVDVAPADGGFAVLLDGRTLRTPAKKLLVVPAAPLAEACAEEWESQGEILKPETMPVSRLVNVALDHAASAREGLVGRVLQCAETDLLCHRAERPADLVARQEAMWNPPLEWAAKALSAPLTAGASVLAIAQPPESLAALAAAAAAKDDFALTGLAHAAGLAGSAVLGFALAERWLDGQTVFAAACLDDLYGLEKWGEDALARERLDSQRAEFAALAAYFAALG